jgi:type I restriction enzyme S subunit
MGQSPKGSTYNEEGEGMIFFQGKRDFGKRFPTIRVYTTEPKRIAKAGDCLLSVRAPVGTLNIALEKCCIGRGLAAISHKKGYSSFCFYTLQNFEQQFISYDGEGTVFGSINRTTLGNLKYAKPSDKILKAFEVLVKPIDEQIRNQTLENQTLSKTRDLLLPKLMSGEIEV